MTRTLEIRAVAVRPRSVPVERLLLVVGGLFVALNTASLALQRGGDFTQWAPLLVWTGCAVVGERLLAYRLPQRDPLFFPLALFLAGWGLLIVDRLAPAMADRQSLWLVLGTAVMLGIVWLRPLLYWLRRYRYTLLLASLVLLVATIQFGTNPSGAEGAPTLWLGIGGLYGQPSEPLKVMLVIFLASYLAAQYPAMRAGGRRAIISPALFGPLLLMWGISVVVLVWQRDLGTAVLVFAVFILLLYIASGMTSLLVIGALLVVAAGIAAYALFAVVRLRVDIWLNPWPEASDRAYQIVQSLMAFGAGGAGGQGIGQGAPGFIPVAHSDFVFAALAEEWGLLGVVAVLVFLATYVVRAFRTGAGQPDSPFRALLAVGLGLLIGMQALLIMGGILKLIPLTGVTLPFVSYGGSSLVTSFIITGLLLRLSAREN
ncbi:MAG TPA: FtsW/RodA/SpoVE family cell cycle protein [Candidatus Limnocylindrales bacterium]|nr:FtsW/RodA/SpoVE family cell cycle protein [Candidatus Limnocylindrales bacterium]